ncbi:MAG: hypothetical protein ACO1RX_23225 [Candidatus Sericytochromatia bacterium]
MPNVQNQAKQALQTLMSQVSNPRVTTGQFEEWKQHALQDKKLDRDEARFLMDQMAAGRFEQDVIPAVTTLLADGYKAHTANPVAHIGGNEITHVHKVDKSFTLDTAKQITDDNNIDEIYFKDEKGELYVGYGSQEAKGSLDLERVKVGYVGRMDGMKIQVVHINNETNTTWEGAKAPWISAGKTLSEAGQTGVAKGIGEVATTVTALFIGKTVVENGIKTVGEKAAQKTVEAVAGEAVAAAPSLAEKARAFGSTIGSSVKNSLRSVAVGAAVAGAVVGTVVTIGSAIGAVKSRVDHRDFTTLDMITGNY